jgi:hypothetical protein
VTIVVSVEGGPYPSGVYRFLVDLKAVVQLFSKVSKLWGVNEPMMPLSIKLTQANVTVAIRPNCDRASGSGPEAIFCFKSEYKVFIMI